MLHSAHMLMLINMSNESVGTLQAALEISRLRSANKLD